MVVDLDAFVSQCRQYHTDGLRVVFTNGCFDILHRGHVEYLVAARKEGDVLVVAVNSDASVRRLKGMSRPVIAQDDRAFIVAALRPVDLVTIFDDETPLSLILTIAPDILVKGGDYDPEASDGPRYIVGSAEVRAAGGRVAVIPLVPGISTSEIVQRASRI